MYQQEPQTPPPPYYPPPYPPQKKGMSAGAITAVILSVVVFFSAFGAFFYLRFLKNKPAVEPTETPPVTSPPVSMEPNQKSCTLAVALIPTIDGPTFSATATTGLSVSLISYSTFVVTYSLATVLLIESLETSLLK